MAQIPPNMNDDLALLIVQYLWQIDDYPDYRSILRLSVTCRYFREFIFSSKCAFLWKQVACNGSGVHTYRDLRLEEFFKSLSHVSDLVEDLEICCGQGVTGDEPGYFRGDGGKYRRIMTLYNDRSRYLKIFKCCPVLPNVTTLRTDYLPHMYLAPKLPNLTSYRACNPQEDTLRSVASSWPCLKEVDLGLCRVSRFEDPLTWFLIAESQLESVSLPAGLQSSFRLQQWLGTTPNAKTDRIRHLTLRHDLFHAIIDLNGHGMDAEVIANCTNLESLVLLGDAFSSLNRRDLANLSTLPNLKKLEMDRTTGPFDDSKYEDNCPISDADFAAFFAASAFRLQSLIIRLPSRGTLPFDQPSDSTLEAIMSKMDSMEYFQIDGDFSYDCLIALKNILENGPKVVSAGDEGEDIRPASKYHLGFICAVTSQISGTEPRISRVGFLRSFGPELEKHAIDRFNNIFGVSPKTLKLRGMLKPKPAVTKNLGPPGGSCSKSSTASATLNSDDSENDDPTWEPPPRLVVKWNAESKVWDETSSDSEMDIGSNSEYEDDHMDVDASLPGSRISAPSTHADTTVCQTAADVDVDASLPGPSGRKYAKCE